MATTINLSVSFTVAVGGQQIINLKPTDSFTASGTNSNQTVQSIGTSAELVGVGEVTTIGYVLIVNLDDTNYVEIDKVNTFDAFPQKLLAGDVILLKPESATIYAKAHTASCDVLICMVEL
jgi:hypothetical protein